MARAAANRATDMFEVSVRTRLLFGATFAIAATIMAATARAQEAEPRAYTNTPIGLNFLIAALHARQDGI